jgi:outer membrane protein OmpA-like peptidoglycan-associated protein
MRPAAQVSSVTVLCAGLLLTACSLLSTAQPSAQGHSPDTTPLTTVRVSQIGFGRDARFTRCIEPECPRVTLKVLASAPVPVADPVVEGPPARTRAAAIPATDVVQSQAPAATQSAIEPRKVLLHFEANSARLTPSHKALLSDALDGLLRTDRIVIRGRTDNLGSEALNQALALARGLSVRDQLLDLAPDLPARISIDAKGRCCYAAPNDSSHGRALNRRVELLYVSRDEVAL